MIGSPNSWRCLNLKSLASWCWVGGNFIQIWYLKEGFVESNWARAPWWSIAKPLGSTRLCFFPHRTSSIYLILREDTKKWTLIYQTYLNRFKLAYVLYFDGLGSSLSFGNCVIIQNIIFRNSEVFQTKVLFFYTGRIMRINFSSQILLSVKPQAV